MVVRKRMTLDITNPRSIEKTIKYFEKMRDELPKKYQQLCSELADIGIQVAIACANGSELAPYVMFSKEIKKANQDGCEMIMFGRNIGQVFGEGVPEKEINAILMLEYGSGQGADPIQVILDGQLVGGRGSYPSPSAVWNANDPKGWFYRDKNGVLHHSTGEQAQYPMQRAYDYMQTQVDDVIRKVFTL